jgi:pSer/pThr/pTyr-binding forkhead associated (FHA) protein
MKTGQLTVVEGPTLHLEQVFLWSDKGERLLGRSSVCHFRLLDPLVSSLHCNLYHEQDNFIVEDLLSANGVLLNEAVVDSASLHVGDRLRVGKTLLEFAEYMGEKQGKVYITGEQVNISLHDDDVEDAQIAPVVTGGTHLPLGRLIKKAQDLNICRLALKNRLVTSSQIRQMLELQKEKIQHHQPCSLTDILVAQKLLQQEQVDKLLQEHNAYKVRHKDIQFGKVVIEQKLVSEAKVQECLALQERYLKESGKMPRLGEVLVQKGYLSIQQNNRLIKALMHKKQQEA